MKASPTFSQNLHQNADSWRVFGELCRRDLELRAFEEPDLVKVRSPFLLHLLVFFPYKILLSIERRNPRISSRSMRNAPTHHTCQTRSCSRYLPSFRLRKQTLCAW